MEKTATEISCLTSAVVIGIMLLCITDAFFTLIILNNGGNEINPFMNMCIKVNDTFFFGVKYCLTALCVLVIVAYDNDRIFKYFRCRHVLYLMLSLYIILICYELIIMQEHIHVFN